MVPHNTDIRTLNEPAIIVDCLSTKIYEESPAKLIAFFASKDNSLYNDYLRVSCVPYLFHECERIFKGDKDPIAAYAAALDQLLAHLKNISASDMANIFTHSSENNGDHIFSAEVKEHTGQHYGSLFQGFSQMAYFDEAKKLLEDRLRLNNSFPDNLQDAVVLDQGCGGGRYSIAWSLLGAKSVTGADFSDSGIEDGRLRTKMYNITNVDFVKANALELPFEDESFDVVYSNGVLHHTEDWEKGIKEQVRVLKTGGFGWQYLIEAPGGLFWDNIEILRCILKDVNKNYAQHVLKLYNIAGNRIFYMLDHVMVPINTRVTAEELEKALISVGAKNIKRFKRGASFDRVEQIANKTPYAKEKFGIGEHRYVFSK